MIYGTFGIGKSFIIRQVAQQIAQEKSKEFIEWNRITYEKKKEIIANPSQYFVLIDIRLSEYDSSDVKGLPDFKDEDNIIWKSPYWTKILEHPESDGFLFFDEINLATPLVLSSCYKIIYDRIINEGSIGDNWGIISAGNLAGDKAYTNEIPYPLRDRCGECMEGKTSIICKGEIKNISNIKIGDIVLDRYGEYNRVLEISKRKTNNLIKIKSVGKLPIYITKNHPILTKSKNGKGCWKLAEELKIGDKIGTPIIKGEDNSKINKDVSLLLGFYTANGWKDKGKTKNRINLSFNSKHIKKIKLMKKIISANFTKNISIRKRKDNSTTLQFFTNKAEWIENNCGKYAKNKHIPYILLNNQNKKLLENFLYGYYLGDGCLVNKQFIAFTTVSKQLALEIQLAFTRLGFFCNIREDKKVRTSKIGERTIKSCGNKFLIRTYDLQAEKIFKIKMNKKKCHTKHYSIEYGCLWTKIKSIEKIKRKCNVYNFEVDKSNSYIANNIIVHNCELLEPNHDSWINWAIENDLDYRIIGFINFSPSKLRVVDDNDTQKSTTPRAWERVNSLINGVEDYPKLELVVGTAIGEGVAREFISFCKIKDEVQLDRVLQFPDELKKVTEISTKYFVISAVADHYGKGNKVDFVKLLDISRVLDEMNNPDFITLMWRLAIKYNPTKFRKDFQSKELDNPLRIKYNKYLMPSI